MFTTVSPSRLLTVLLVLLTCGLAVEGARWVKLRQELTELEDLVAKKGLSRGATWSLTPPGKPGLVVAVSPDCDVCEERSQLHKELIGLASKLGVAVTVLAPSTADAGVLADQLATPRQSIVLADLRRVGIKSVPAILLIDDGVVQEMLIGRLGPVQQGYASGLVSGRIAAPLSTPSERIPFELSESEYANLPSDLPTRLVDIQPRTTFALSHRPESQNVPVDEIFVRAPSEFSSSEWIVLDCAKVDERLCRNAARALGTRGFLRVSAIDIGKAPPAQCLLP